MTDRGPAMPGQPLHRLPDAALEQELRDLGTALVIPSARRAGADLAVRVRRELESRPAAAPHRRWWQRLDREEAATHRGRVRRGVLLALAALLVLAAVAGAAGLGLPGVRILFEGGTTASPGRVSPDPSGIASPVSSPSAPLGSGLGLGRRVSLDEARATLPFTPLLPADPALRHVDEAWLAEDRLSLVYAATAELPATIGGTGLLITQFRGRVEDGYYQKLVGATRIESVRVNGRPAYWLSGAPHGLVYVDANGVVREETRRIVGDVLIWEVEGVTLRLESTLGRDAAIAIAEGMTGP